MITLSGVFYFLSLAVGMLYINMVLVGRRHWAGGEEGWGRGTHALVRVVAMLIALGSLNALVGRTGARADVTAERVHTLTSESIALIKQIPKDRPVYIQAYLQPRSPARVCRDQDRPDRPAQGVRGQGRRPDPAQPRADRALLTRGPRRAETVRHRARRVINERRGARQESAEIFLGVAFTSGLEEVVIPFFDRGLPVEYELTRSIRVVSRSNRKKVGILNTDAKLMGGFDMRSMGQNPEWSIVTELKKQYDVDSVSPDVPDVARTSTSCWWRSRRR